MIDEFWAYLQAPKNEELWKSNNTYFKRLINKVINNVKQFFKDMFNIEDKDITTMSLNDLLNHTAKELQNGELSNKSLNDKTPETNLKETLKTISDKALLDFLINKGIVKKVKCA